MGKKIKKVNFQKSIFFNSTDNAGHSSWLFIYRLPIPELVLTVGYKFVRYVGYDKDPETMLLLYDIRIKFDRLYICTFLLTFHSAKGV